MDAIIAQILAFMACFMLVTSVERVIRVRRNPTHEAAGSRRTGFFLWFEAYITVLGSFVATRFERGNRARRQAIDSQLRAAALDKVYTARDIWGAQAFAALAASLLAGLTLSLLGVPPHLLALSLAAIVFVAWAAPATWLKRRSVARQDAIAKSLPYAVDLLTTAMEAGQDFGAAVRYMVTHGMEGPLGQEFRATLHAIDLGKERGEALKQMAERVQIDEMTTLVSAMVQSIESGGSLVGTLRMQAEDIRRARFHRAERKAAKAPSLMILPMVVFIVPAMFIIVLTPVIIRVLIALGKIDV